MNKVTDVGLTFLSEVIRDSKAFRELRMAVGFGKSDYSENSLKKLAEALEGCPNLIQVTLWLKRTRNQSFSPLFDKIPKSIFHIFEY